MDSYYETASRQLYHITGWDRATSAELLVLHGSTPRR